MAIPTINVACGVTHIDLVSALIFVGISFFLYLIVSLSVNLEFGYAGVPNFGKVLFVAAGGLIAGSLSYRLALYVLNLHSSDVIASQALFQTIINQQIISTPIFGLELFLFALAVGALTAAVFGYLASFPAIRLREDYLGMLLLAAGQFFLIFVTAYMPITGGTGGLLVPDPFDWASSTNGLRDIVALGVLALAALLVYLYSERVARSPLGRMLRAVRDNEISSEAIGKDTTAVRRNILIIGSALAGIAGVLYVEYTAAIAPTTFMRTEWTFYPFVIVILGGAANNKGVGLGSLVFAGLTQFIAQANGCLLANNVKIPFGIDVNSLVPIALGLLLLIVLLWRPKGLIPEKPTHTLSKNRLQQFADRIEQAQLGGAVPEAPQSTESEDMTVPKVPEEPQKPSTDSEST